MADRNESRELSDKLIRKLVEVAREGVIMLQCSILCCIAQLNAL